MVENQKDIIIWKEGYYGWWDAYLNGNKLLVPSITKIVDLIPDPGMDEWVKNVGEEKAKSIMKLAADRGTVMHTLLEHYYLAKSIKGDPQKALLYAIQKTNIVLKTQDIDTVSFRTGTKLFEQLKDSLMDGEIYKLTGLEKIIANFQYFYRGKYDISYTDPNNMRYITDFKASSSAVEPNSIKEKKYKVQLVGYWLAYEMMTGKSLDYAKLWISTKNNGVQEISVTKEEKNSIEPYFISLCDQWHKENGQDLKLLQNFKYKIQTA